jgi:hypothetical protein
LEKQQTAQGEMQRANPDVESGFSKEQLMTDEKSVTHIARRGGLRGDEEAPER